MKNNLLFVLFFHLIYCSGFTQVTVVKNGKEFFNGEEGHLYAYLNNNYYNLDPIEGIWSFTRIDYDEFGNEVNRTPNEFKVAIVRDLGNFKRAFVEVNLSRALCKKYQITYNVQTGGGSNFYPLEPLGCSSTAGNYMYDPSSKMISREGFSIVGNKALLIGVRIFPHGPPTQEIPMPGGVVADETEVTNRKARVITHESGWEPYIDWGRNIFPAYLLSMNDLDPKTLRSSDDYLGDPVSVVGVLVKAPRNSVTIKIEIEPTSFSRGTTETFTLSKKNKQYAIFPKILWDYEKLRGTTQATYVDFVFRVTLNGKTNTQTATANLRAIDDCPLFSYDYQGNRIDLKILAAAYVNEGHPAIKNFTTEIRQNGLIRDFIGMQGGKGPAFQQIYAFWKLLRDKGISYSSITNNGQQDEEVFSQRIRLLEDIIKETQANCIDGTALLASCLEAINIPTTLVFIPGHAFLAYNVSQDVNNPQYYFLETTMLGDFAKGIPDEYARMADEEPYLTMKKALYSQFNNGKTNKNQEIEHFLAASLRAHQTFKAAVARSEKDVMAVDIQAARKFIRPIYRSGSFTVITPDGHIVTPPTEEPALPDGNLVPQEPGSNTAPLNRRRSLATSSTVLTDTPNKKKPVVPISNKPNAPSPKTEKSPPANQTRKAPLQEVPVYVNLKKHRGNQSYDLAEFETDAPTMAGEYYKVQVENTPFFKPNNPSYEGLKKLGAFHIEIILPEKKKTRVLIGDFATYEKAIPVAKEAQNAGFKNVAIVKYTNGDRLESIYRDWKVIKN